MEYGEKCPSFDCEGHMVLRKADVGRFSGNEFMDAKRLQKKRSKQ